MCLIIIGVCIICTERKRERGREREGRDKQIGFRTPYKMPHTQAHTHTFIKHTHTSTQREREQYNKYNTMYSAHCTQQCNQAPNLDLIPTNLYHVFIGLKRSKETTDQQAHTQSGLPVVTIHSNNYTYTYMTLSITSSLLKHQVHIYMHK